MLPLTPVPPGEITQARIEGYAEHAVPGDVAVELEHWDVKGWLVDVTFGLLAVVAGVAGLVLPFLPGWAPIIGGVVLLAGRIPPLRRLLSRFIMLSPCQGFLDRLACNPKMRKVMAKALLRKKIRNAVEPTARREMVHLLLRKDAENETEAETIAGTDPARGGDKMV
jgi:uncharacterized membrane protein YbaN (DUF454 family)